ncbi:MAG: 4Fe-4S binding protein [Candidatus Vecturithrix sp.]|jgi:polyferredoxin|nr:4Fe-4S binding protein [Candidatus Vecturithrix sp.]
MKRYMTRKIRLAVQIFFLLLIVLFSVNHYRAEQGLEPILVGSASLHAVCPFGGVVSIYTYFSTGVFVKKTHVSSFILMWIVLLLSLGLGAVFCGWVCPFGTVQELIGKIGRKLFKRRYNQMVPAQADRYLRYLRYGILAIIIYLTATAGTLIFAEYDPYFALFNIWSDEVVWTALAILILTLAGALLIERPWCKYACPYGALLGIFNLFKLVKLSRNPQTCINCHRCDRVCPMNITPSDDGNVRNHQCIVCLECTSENVCPVDDALLLKIRPEATTEVAS